MGKEIFLFNRETFSKDNYEEARALALELAEEARKEKGALMYDVFEDVGLDYTICILEKWETYEDLENHWKAEHFNTIVPKLTRMAKDRTEVFKFRKID